MSIMKMKAFVVLTAIACILGGVAGECSYEGIFNLGDSNSDSGAYFSAFPSLGAPFGITYFQKPVERVSDGRLIIDFLAQAVGIPFLSPYLRSTGSNFSHGANFATAGSTVLQPSTAYVSPFYLEIQLKQLKHFKNIVDDHSPADANVGSEIPEPDIFGKSIYTIYIGQNDFTRNSQLCGVETSVQRQVVSGITTTIKEIYNSIGGRTFFVFNLAPVGCYPFLLVQSRNASDLDPVSGCLISCNNAVDEYNSLLKGALDQTRQELADADLIHVDTNAILLNIFKNHSSYGMEYATRACCGYGGGPYNFQPQVVYCGYTGTVGGQKVNATVCSDRQRYVNWDGIHLTDAANRIVAEAVLAGSYFDPPFPISNFCDIQPIG